MKCWGDASDGKIGNAPNVSASSPATVPKLIQVTQLAVADTFTCALIAGCTVSCWGSNAYGQLGYGCRLGRSTPTPVPGLTNVVQISGGTTQARAVTSVGALLCWGDELAALGGGPNTNRLSPAVIVF